MDSLAAQKGAKAKLESKVSQWEAKLVELRGMGDEDQIAMAEHSLGKAKEKVEEKEEAIVVLDRSVRRMETILAAEVDEVKEEEVEEVVEVEVEAEEVVEETVKEEVEAKVVVETAVGGGGERVAEVFLGVEDGLDSPVFVAAGAPTVVGGGEVGMGGRGGEVHLDKPMRLGEVREWWGWQRELPGKKWGETPPPPPGNGGEDV